MSGLSVRYVHTVAKEVRMIVVIKKSTLAEMKKRIQRLETLHLKAVERAEKAIKDLEKATKKKKPECSHTFNPKWESHIGPAPCLKCGHVVYQTDI